MTTFSKPLLSFEDVRQRARSFCNDREWSKFHQPRNLAMALAGECGELSEIFQWKGSLPNGLDQTFSPADKIHVGEEIADVFIYSTRLCDICNINLPGAINHYINPKELIQSYRIENHLQWFPLTFNNLENYLNEGKSGKLVLSRSPRDIIFDVHTHLGVICDLFLSHPEEKTLTSLEAWPHEDVSTLAVSIGKICILLSWLANICGLHLIECVADKMTKNEKKYPVNLAKGSSAKYTAYNQIIQINTPTLALLGLTTFFSGMLFGLLKLNSK